MFATFQYLMAGIILTSVLVIVIRGWVTPETVDGSKEHARSDQGDLDRARETQKV
jgi:hypothetical protein